GLVKTPVLQIPRVEQSTQKAQETPVVHLFAQYLQQHLVVEAVEALGNIPFNEPDRPGPGLVDVAQGGVASASWPESMGAVGKLRLLVTLHKEAHEFFQQVIRPRGATQQVHLLHSE